MQIKYREIVPKSIKFIEENIGKTCQDSEFKEVFDDRIPKARAIASNPNKWDYTKLKSFCIAKEIQAKIKRQLIEWEKKMLKNHQIYMIFQSLFGVSIPRTENMLPKECMHTIFIAAHSTIAISLDAQQQWIMNL